MFSSQSVELKSALFFARYYFSDII